MSNIVTLVLRPHTASKPMNRLKFYGDTRLKQLVRHADAGQPKSARRALDVLRVGLWFEALRAQLGCATAYGLGQLIQPNTYKKGLHHNNLWAKYAAGRHLPGPETVRASAMKIPGSEEMIASPAWLALDVTESLEGGGGDAVLRSLRPRIQSAVFEGEALTKGLYVRRRSLGVSLKILQGEADLQSLGATVVLLRDAHATGERSRAFTIGQSLHRTLLMAAVGSPLKFIAIELFEFFIRNIFPMAEDRAFAMDLDKGVLHEQAVWLRRTALQQHAAGKPGFSLVGNTRQLRRLLEFDFGFDLMYGLAPRLKLTVPPEEAGGAARDFVARNNVRCDWGRTILRSGKCVRFPPDHVF